MPVDDNIPSRRKAREMLHHGTVRGMPLTEGQRGLFGAISSGYPVRDYNPVEGSQWLRPVGPDLTTPEGQCEGCGKSLGVFDAGYSVCMGCTRARHAAATSGHRCHCGAKRREREVSAANRRWISCDRCLGVVRQLNPGVRGTRIENRRRNPQDEEIRALQRLAQQGGERAAKKLIAMRKRAGTSPKWRGSGAQKLWSMAKRISTPSPEWVQAFIAGSLDAALWASNDEEGVALEENYSAYDIDPTTQAEMISDSQDFIESNARDLAGLDPRQAGQDFWLTRNRHGSGFWDRGIGVRGDRLTRASHPYGPYDLYIGDDGRIHGQ